MSYLVFSRKFRPERFSEVADQKHVTETLERALETGRVGQAYLFSGPRGIGKTSIARILAKALNCHEGVKPVPCNKCPSCLEIARSSSLDVFEIDGASNRRIEEVRDLRENVKFSPARDRYKIYIIDEVHMLTNEAFNALLKTLEEPPEHVKFIFATTAPHKIPLTIISRCQRFELRRISADTISKILSDIAKKEKIKVEGDAIEAISGLAAGSIRDAQSIFDQLSSSVKGTLKKKDVDSILGIIPTETYLELGDSVIKADTLKALEITGKAIDDGKDIEQFLKSWIKYWRDLLMVKTGCKELTDMPKSEHARLERQAKSFSRKEILDILEIMFNADELVKKTSSSRIPLEIAAAELTMLKNPGEKPKKDSSENEEQEPLAAEEINPPPSEPEGELTIETLLNSWAEVLEEVKKESARVHAFLVEGKPSGVGKDGINILFSKKFHRESCEKKENKKIIEDILEKLFHRRLAVSCLESQGKTEKTQPAEKTAGEKPGKTIKQDALKNSVVKEVSEIFKVDILEVKEEKKS